MKERKRKEKMGWDEEYMVTLYFVSFEIKEHQIVTRIQKRIKPFVNVSTLSADKKLISVPVIAGLHEC